MDPDNLPTCTSDARQVVNELYRHMLERATVASSNTWVMDVDTVRELCARLRPRRNISSVSGERGHPAAHLHTEGTSCTREMLYWNVARSGITLVRSVALSAAPVRLRRSEHPRDGAATLVTAGRLSPVWP